MPYDITSKCIDFTLFYLLNYEIWLRFICPTLIPK